MKYILFIIINSINSQKAIDTDHTEHASLVACQEAGAQVVETFKSRGLVYRRENLKYDFEIRTACIKK